MRGPTRGKGAGVKSAAHENEHSRIDRLADFEWLETSSQWISRKQSLADGISAAESGVGGADFAGAIGTQGA